MNSLQTLNVGDIVSLETENGTRFRRVLSASGAGEFRTYGMSCAGRSKDGSSMKKYFVTLTAYELENLDAEVVA
jgi:hypothetical protein